MAVFTPTDPNDASSFVKSQLPPFLEEVEIRQLKVGSAVVDLARTRHDDNVSVRPLRREGRVEVVSVQ